MLDFKTLMALKPEEAPKRVSRDIDRLADEVAKKDNTKASLHAIMADKSIPLLERIKAREALRTLEKEQAKKAKVDLDLGHEITESSNLVSKPHETFSLDIVLSQEQQLAADMAAAGKSFVLSGKAGTGKTTAAREIARSLLKNGVLGYHHFGYYKTTGPSIAFSAYTNRATDNMRRALHKDTDLEEKLKFNVLTIHKLLEYTMEWRENPDTGKRYPYFFPLRNATRKLDLTHLIIEEGSMVDIPLWRQVFDALKPGTSVIIIGDINQLPPIFGPSVTNYAIVQIPVVELTKVYRQALESPILSNALAVLDGKNVKPDGTYFKLYQSKPGSRLPSEKVMAMAAINSIKKWIESGEYDVKTDIVLSPFNKERFPCGTKMLNYHIAQYLGDKRGAKIHQIFAGRNTVYLAEGDRVMIEKQDGVITKINPNGLYMGKAPVSTYTDINRFGKPTLNGHKVDIDHEDFELEGYEDLDVDKISDEEKKLAASHSVHVLMDDGSETVLESAGDFSDTKFNLGYCLSVHKAQGSEWRKVVFVIHRNFKVLLFRELIYTAMTRAREYLTIIDMSNVLAEGLASQRIKGNTIKEKIEWFNSKLTLNEVVPIVP